MHHQGGPSALITGFGVLGHRRRTAHRDGVPAGAVTSTATLRNVTAVGTGGMVNGIFVLRGRRQTITHRRGEHDRLGVPVDVIAQSEGTAAATPRSRSPTRTTAHAQRDRDRQPRATASRPSRPVGTTGNQTTPPAFVLPRRRLPPAPVVDRHDRPRHDRDHACSGTLRPRRQLRDSSTETAAASRSPTSAPTSSSPNCPAPPGRTRR